MQVLAREGCAESVVDKSTVSVTDLSDIVIYRRVTMKYRHRLKSRSANRHIAKGKRFACS